MAGETDPFTERAREGWNKFSTLLGVATLGIFVVLGLMAIFLVFWS